MIRIFSPGRINIIGEHTDHQGGLVLPACIHLGIEILGKKTTDPRVSIKSTAMNERVTIDLTPHDLVKKNHWSDYIVGCVDQFHKATGILPSAELTISSNLPIGSGLSSSAALEVGVCQLFNEIYHTELSRKEIAIIAWKAETEFVGVNCGLMDQSVIALSTVASPLMIDCKNMETETIDFDDSLIFLIVDTGRHRTLATSNYNLRIEELKHVRKEVIELGYDIDVLSDLSEEDLHEVKRKWQQSDKYIRRLSHVITENGRVIDYIRRVNTGKYLKAGELLRNSHNSLRYDFEASWDRADRIVEVLDDIERVHGSRMLGGGWGGNVLVQICKDDLDPVVDEIIDTIDFISPEMVTPAIISPGVKVLTE